MYYRKMRELVQDTIITNLADVGYCGTVDSSADYSMEAEALVLMPGDSCLLSESAIFSSLMVRVKRMKMMMATTTTIMMMMMRLVNGGQVCTSEHNP